jgi:Flp pilus assembly protein TadD
MKHLTRTFLWGSALIVLVTIVAYLPAIRGGFIWDDDKYLTDNPTMRSVEGLREIWLNPDATVQYYPLTFTVFWIEHQLWGLNPLGYHVVNVLLHAVNAVLFWILLKRLNVPGAWWAAAVFALHPVHVMSVAWITELKNVLSGVFFLLALLAYLRFSDSGQKSSYGLALGLYVAALLSKTATSILPVAIVLILWWKRGRVERKYLAPILPFLALAIGFGAFTLWLEKFEKGAFGWEFAVPFPERLLVAGRSFWFCLGKLVWPVRLTFIYPRWEMNPANVDSYLFLFGAVAVLVALWWMRSRIGRAPFAALLYFALAFPSLVLVQVLYMMRYSFVSDHWQYLGSLGVIALVVGALVLWVERSGEAARRMAPVVGVVVLTFLGGLTWRQGYIYRDVETLWRDTLAKNPKAVMAHNNLGNLLMLQGNAAEAVEHYEQALRYQPDFAEAHYNLGFALAHAGQTEAAIQEFERALRLKPDEAKTHYNLGAALMRMGRLAEAINQFESAVRIKPGYPEAHNDWGTALTREGKLDEAVGHFEEALRLKPEYPEAQNNLGVALAMKHSFDEAITHFSEALRLRPDFPDAARNLRNAQGMQKNPQQTPPAKVQIAD